MCKVKWSQKGQTRQKGTNEENMKWNRCDQIIVNKPWMCMCRGIGGGGGFFNTFNMVVVETFWTFDPLIIIDVNINFVLNKEM